MLNLPQVLWAYMLNQPWAFHAHTPLPPIHIRPIQCIHVGMQCFFENVYVETLSQCLLCIALSTCQRLFVCWRVFSLQVFFTVFTLCLDIYLELLLAHYDLKRIPHLCKMIFFSRRRDKENKQWFEIISNNKKKIIYKRKSFSICTITVRLTQQGWLINANCCWYQWLKNRLHDLGWWFSYSDQI